MFKCFLAVLLFLGSFFVQSNAKADEIDDMAKCVSAGRTHQECFNIEAKRFLGIIEAKYADLGKMKEYDGFKMANASTNPEKFKKLFNMWKLYAQNYCNIFSYGFRSMGGEEEVRNQRDECLYNQTLKQLSDVNSFEFTLNHDTY